MGSNNIILNKNEGFEWVKNKNVCVKGYGFSGCNFLKGNELASHFSEVEDADGLEEKINKLNGFFSVVIDLNDFLLFAVDHVRSIPLFYSQKKGFRVTDSPEDEPWQPDGINPLQVQSMLLSGFTTHNETLASGIFQLQAGEIGVHDKISAKTHVRVYYRHNKVHQREKSPEVSIEIIEESYLSAFERLITSLKGKTPVIPLSGGFDSRSIASFLKRMGIKDALCYTYGKKNSYEVAIAKKVSEQLGYKLIFVEYNKETWGRYFGNDAYQYIGHAHGMSSSPHVQDFPAIHKLKNDKLIPDNSVIIPGYCGDYLGGSLFPSKDYFNKNKITRQLLCEHIFENRYALWNNTEDFVEYREIAFQSIRDETINHNLESELDFINTYEYWIVRNFISKYIINSLRIYEYFGYEWRMPLWDIGLIETWYKASIAQKRGKLYDKYLCDKIFEPLGVNFNKSVLQKSKKTGVAGIVRSIVKDNKFIQRLYSIKKDANGFDYLIDKFISDLNGNKTENKYENRKVNHYNTIWFLEKFILKGSKIDEFIGNSR